MGWLTGKSRSLGVGIIVALLGVAVLPGFAAAGSSSGAITFDLTIGWYCVEGNATPGPVELTWKDADGHRKARASVTARVSDGKWSYCATDGDVVEIGDRVRATEGGVSRLFIVPQLSLVINRVDDTFKGRGPANSYVRLYCWYTNGFEPCILSWKLKVNSQGKWSFNPNNDFGDVVGWQSMGLRWKSAIGDAVWISAAGPYVDAAIGSPVVRGATRANAIATVVLRRGTSNDVVATAVTRADPDGDFVAKFRNAQGNKVKVRAGDRITSDVSPDEDWIVPNVTATANAATNIVSGQCPENSMFVRATVVRNGFADGNTDWPEEDYSFSLDMTEVQIDLQPGETVRTSCFVSGPGDWTGRQIVAH